VPWRFSDAGRRSAWIVSSSRRPKTCTGRDICTAAHDVFIGNVAGPPLRPGTDDTLINLIDRLEEQPIDSRELMDHRLLA
jgi:hypothetical protein